MTLNENRIGAAAVEQQVALDAVNSPKAVPAGPARSNGAFNAERRSYSGLASSIGTNIEAERMERVKQIADRTLINRGDQWIDARILESDDGEDENPVKPVREIAFDSDEYWDLLEDLVKTNRQGLLSTVGELVLLIDGEQVLVHNRAPEADADDQADEEDEDSDSDGG